MLDTITGNHGFDPFHEDMIGIFLAQGSAFKKGVNGTRNDVVKDSIENVNLYSLAMHVLHLQPSPNNGSYSAFDMLLQ